MKDYFFISSEGDLYDTRKDNWHAREPLRRNYRRQHADITSLADVKAVLRAGAYTEMGGCPLYFLSADGATLSFDAVRANWGTVVWDYMHDASTSWRVVACRVNYEDSGLTCEHSGSRIPSAYDG